MATMNIMGVVRAEKYYKKRTTTHPNDFKTLYRFEEENVEWLTNYFLEPSTETRGGALTPKNRMKIFLRYVSDPGFQSGVGEDVGCDQTTVSKVVDQVS